LYGKARASFRGTCFLLSHFSEERIYYLNLYGTVFLDKRDGPAVLQRRLQMQRFTISAIAACAVAITAISTSAAHADDVQCKINATHTGNLFSGTVYKTYAEYPFVAAPVAFKKVLMGLMDKGWSIRQEDKEMGIISASAQGNAFNNHPPTVSVSVESEGSGSKVTTQRVTPAGNVATSAVEDMCKVYIPLDSN
jgi:hypothetical protein